MFDEYVNFVVRKKNKYQVFSFLFKDARSKQQTDNATKNYRHRNSFHKGQSLRFHVAKKSPTSVKF